MALTKIKPSNIEATNFTFANVTANVVTLQAVSANGSVGANGTVLASNGTTSYWAVQSAGTDAGMTITYSFLTAGM